MAATLTAPTLFTIAQDLEPAVEAGVRQGWGRYTGRHGLFVGMHGFGASGPYKDVYLHFAITAESVAEAAKSALKA